MPPKSKRQIHSLLVNHARSNQAKESAWSSDEETPHMSMDIEEDSDDEDEHMAPGKLDIHAIGDLFQMCKNECGSRKLSVLVYLILRFSGQKWDVINDLLGQMGAYRCESAHKWSQVFLSNDMEGFCDDGRGGKQSDSFYDAYPELETEGKAFAISACSRKSADFTASNLALFLDGRFYQLTQSTKTRAYSQGASYGDVLKMFFSNLCKPDVTSHRRISNRNLDLE